MKFRILFLISFWMLPLTALAQDQDDTVIRGEDHSGMRLDVTTVSSSQSNQLVEKNPELAKSVETFIRNHYQHANEKQFEAYMNDFSSNIAEKPAHQNYARKVMDLPGLKIDLRAIEYQELLPKSAIVHAHQRTQYYVGEYFEDVDSIISFRLRWVENEWKIIYSERKRLTK